MSRNLRLQVVLNAVDKLTRPFRSAQESNKRLAGAVRQSRDALKDLNRQAGQIDGFRKTKQQLTETQQAYQAATQRAAALAREMNASGNPTRQQAEALKRAQREAGQLKNRFEQLQRSTQQQRTALQANGISTTQLGQAQRRLNSDIARTTQQLQRQEQQLRRSAEQERRMAAAKGSYQKTMDVRNKMAGTGAAAMATGGAALYAGKKFMAPGYDFEVGMSKVQALTRLDKNSEEYKALREQARQLGATTAFTANEVAQGQSFYAMAGFKPEQIQNAMKGTLSMSLAGDIDLATTADIGSNILTGFKLNSDEMNRVSDTLVATFTRSNTNLNMLGDTMKYVAPVASGLGVDLETAAVAAGKLGDAGIQGSMAGTSLRSILGRLAEPPKQAADALEELNIKTRDAKGNLRGLPEILADLDKKTKKMGTAQRAGYFKHIAGEEAFSALSVLTDQAGSGELQKMIAEVKAAKGEAQKVADTMTNNLDGDLKNLTSAWEDVGIQIFGGVDSPLRDIAKSITDIISKVGDWAKRNPELANTLTKIALALGVILAVGGAIVLMLAAMLGPVAMLKLSLSVLGIKGAGAFGLLAKGLKAVGLALFGIGKALLTNPLFLAAAAIAAIAYAIYKNWDTIVAFFKKVWTEVVRIFSSAWDSISAYFSGMWTNISNACSAAWNWITNIVTGAWAAIKNFFLQYSLPGIIYRNWDGIKKYMSELWETVKTTIKTKWDQIITDIQNLPATMKQAASDMIDSVINGINEKWKDLKNKFAEIKQMAKDALTPDWLKEAKQDPKFVAAVEATKQSTTTGGIRNANWTIPDKKFAGAYDSGGHIPRGQWGIVGENGPEVVDGPANVTGRKNTAALAMLALSTLSQPIAAAPAQTAGGSVSSAYSSQQNAAPVINIYPTPVHSAQDIASEVARQLDAHARRQQASRRSGYSDTEEF
ncbi:phage tail tape measure protein, TP901 family, core region domain protein [Morganella morganii subsp. morganii KT]|uniref:Phage tail tape measure protein, TP901 family, core region domain protein n=1 Tax=Morganella morganii subsp. morganii KT TaxID=1124991 RepID=J7SJN2_MORMO|nr:phage tail tape measure protein [Morganella morganii]AGG31886.1 phage tail tape measure protein, TP901 family, core region domain protein [Morganella morganii subsp. morganii KT]